MHPSNLSSPLSPTTIDAKPGSKNKLRKNSKDKESAIGPGESSQIPLLPPSKPRVVIDQSIVTALIDHAYSDSRFPVLGYLGGKLANDDALQGDEAVVHVSHFVASERSIPSMLTDTVTEFEDSLERAVLLFRQAGLDCVGWYRSAHSSKKPSRADTLKQLKLQSKTAYCVGIVVSASSTPRPSILSSDYSYNKLSQQITVFRAVESSNTAIEPLTGQATDETEAESAKRSRMFRATRVVFGVNQQLYIEPYVLRQMAQTLTTTLHETRQAYAAQLMDCDDRPSKRMFVDSEYENFLMHFWRENVVQMKKSIDQDFLSLAAAKHDVKRLVSDRMDSIIGTWRKQILKKAANQDTAKIVTDEEMRRRLGELVKKMPQKEGSPARRDLVKDDFTFVRWLDTGPFVNDGSAQKQLPQTPAKQADYVGNAAKPAPSFSAVTPLVRNNKKMKAVVIESPDDKAKKVEDKSDVAEAIGTPPTNHVPTIKNPPPMGIFLDSDKDTTIRSVIPKPPPMGIFLDSDKDKDASARGLSRKPTMGTFMDSDKEAKVRGVVISPLEGLTTAAAAAAGQQRRSSISPGMDSNSLTQRKRPLKKQSIPLEDGSPRIKKARVEPTSPIAQSQFAALSQQLATAVPAMTQITQQSSSPRIPIARPPTEHYVLTAGGSESSYYSNSREGLSSGSTTDLALQGQHYSSQRHTTSSHENYSAQPSGYDALHASAAYQYRQNSVMTTQPTVPTVQLPSIQGILNDVPLPAHRAGSISTTSGPEGSTWVNSTPGQKYSVTNSSGQSPQPYDVSYQRHTDSPSASSHHHPSVKRQSSMAVSTLVNPGYDHVTSVSHPVNDASHHSTTSPASAPQHLSSTNHSLYQTQYNQPNQRQHPNLPHRSQGLSPSPNTSSSVKTGPIGDYHRGAAPSTDQPGALAGAGSEMLADNRRSTYHGTSSSGTHARHRRVSSLPASGNIPLNTPTASVSRGTSPANRRPYHLPYTQSAQQQSVEHERTRLATSSQHHHIPHVSHAQHHHQAYQSNSRRPPVDPVLVAQHLHHQHLEEQLQHHNSYGRRTPSTSSISSPSAPGSRTSSFDANQGSRTSSLDVQRNSFEASHSRTPSFDTHRNSSFDANHSRTPSFDANSNSRASSFDAHRTSLFDASQNSRTPSYDMNRASFDTNLGSKHSSFDTNRNSSIDAIPGSRNLSYDTGKPSDNSVGDIKSIHPHHQQSIHSNPAATYDATVYASSRLLTSSPPPLVKDESQRHNSQSQGQPLGQPQMPPPHSVYWSQQQPPGPQH